MSTAIQKIESQIARNRSQTATRRAAIQEDSRFHESAKQKMLDELDTEAKSTHSELRRQHKEAIGAERDRLRRVAFRKSGSNLADPAANDVNWRNATEQASKATNPGELGTVLERAALTSDTVLQRAALVVAVERGYSDILDAEAANDASLSEYLQFEKTYGSLANPQDRLVRDIELRSPGWLG